MISNSIPRLLASLLMALKTLSAPNESALESLGIKIVCCHFLTSSNNSSIFSSFTLPITSSSIMTAGEQAQLPRQ